MTIGETSGRPRRFGQLTAVDNLNLTVIYETNPRAIIR
jgi:hypothetical protein